MLLAGNIKLGCELNVTSVPLNVSSTNTVLTSNTVCWFWMEADDGVVHWLSPQFFSGIQYLRMNEYETLT